MEKKELMSLNKTSLTNYVDSLEVPANFDYLQKDRVQLSTWRNAIVQEMGTGDEAVRQSAKVVIALISKMIIKANNALNFPNRMTAAQITDTSKEILEYYWEFSFEDLSLFFRYLVNGTLGPLYNRLDQNVIMTKLAEFHSMRMEQIVINKQNQHYETKKKATEFNEEPTPLALTMLQKLRERIKGKHPTTTPGHDGIRAEQAKKAKESIEYLKENDPDWEKYANKPVTEIDTNSPDFKNWIKKFS